MRSSANSGREYRAGNAKRLSARRNLAESFRHDEQDHAPRTRFGQFSGACGVKAIRSPFTVRHSRMLLAVARLGSPQAKLSDETPGVVQCSTFFNIVNYEMPTIAFLGLIARSRLSHSVMGRGAAVLSVRFDAVPF